MIPSYVWNTVNPRNALVLKKHSLEPDDYDLSEMPFETQSVFRRTSS